MGCVVAAILENTTYLIDQVFPICQALCVLIAFKVLSLNHPTTQPEWVMRRWPIILLLLLF